MTTVSNNNHDTTMNLLFDITNVFNSVCPLLLYLRQIKSNLRGRGMNKKSNDSVVIATKFLAKKEEIICNFKTVSGG